ncbi:MAG: enoyl-CoA hydratase/isomerase family protein [Gammaproteobacteria bacterium]|nr:enoyl-CoA hydratase/isomerase family protein [Gammaproteobacteria bacterium]
MIELERTGDVFVLTMNAGENRWNTTFVREVAKALDEVEASTGPAALVTASADVKFFSNGLDLDWRRSDDVKHPGGDRAVFGPEFMALAARMIEFPMPTVCAINGHAFGAGFMIALCHDVRFMRRDRGFICANELDLGMAIPQPELALFRHKIPMNAFFETVQLARRWTGPDAQAAGIVQRVEEQDQLLDAAIEHAGELSRLGANRDIYQWMKQHIYGENAAINGPHGPAHMLRHPLSYETFGKH